MPRSIRAGTITPHHWPTWALWTLLAETTGSRRIAPTSTKPRMAVRSAACSRLLKQPWHSPGHSGDRARLWLFPTPRLLPGTGEEPADQSRATPDSSRLLLQILQDRPRCQSQDPQIQPERALVHVHQVIA